MRDQAISQSLLVGPLITSHSLACQRQQLPRAFKYDISLYRPAFKANHQQLYLCSRQLELQLISANYQSSYLRFTARSRTSTKASKAYRVMFLLRAPHCENLVKVLKMTTMQTRLGRSLSHRAACFEAVRGSPTANPDND
ncbi:hypothetical protein N7465_002684 [Penicillium sp. CMV-2018d]|nr:hypothetical protein N7465_002684 [Penicillium sp. CMV-2018d]